MQLADALARAFADLGADYLFGVSGANIEHLHDAVHRSAALASVLATSEVGAAYMADARARASNGIGICCSTSGAGMMNPLVGLAESRASRVAVIAVIGQPPSMLEGRGAFQDSASLPGNVDALALVRAATKRAEKLAPGDEFWTLLADLAVAALDADRGPVALLVPRDLFELDVGPQPDDRIAELRARLRSPRPTAEDLARFRRALDGSKRPLLVLGEQALRSGQHERIEAFVRRTRLPTTTTMTGKGAFDHFENCFIGNTGIAGHASADRYAAQADLIVVVGCRLDVMNRGTLVDIASAGTPLLAVDVLPPFASEGFAALEHFPFEPGAFFTALLEAEPRAAGQYEGSYPDIEFHPFRPVEEAEATPDAGDEALSFSGAVQCLNPFLRSGEHVYIDAGNTGATALHHLRLPDRCRAEIALGMGGMGYAFAAAVGAQLGDPRQSWVIAGDGAFLMGGLEMRCAIEHELPILFVVLNDAGHGMCRTRQRSFFEGRIEAVDYSEIDTSRIASALAPPSRLFSRRVHTARELAAAIDSYQGQAARTGFVEVLITREEWPPFASIPTGNSTSSAASEDRKWN